MQAGLRGLSRNGWRSPALPRLGAEGCTPEQGRPTGGAAWAESLRPGPTGRLSLDRGIWERQVSWTALQATGRTWPSSLSEMGHL